MKILLNNRGFSLIEILVSIAIAITATTVVVAILSSSFRGISKSTVSEEVRQNGNSAITRMSRTIQFAEGFQGASENGTSYDASCVMDTGKNYQYIRVLSQGTTVTLSCNNNLSVNSSSLIDLSRVKVTEDSCSFSCVQESDVDSPVIGISFELSQASETVPEKTKSIYFSTTVKMRNR